MESDDDMDFDDEGDDEDLEDSEATDAASVTCPYCGESSVIGLDPLGGASQEYVEDCQVCCRPWQVHVRFDDDGQAQVWLGEAE